MKRSTIVAGLAIGAGVIIYGVTGPAGAQPEQGEVPVVGEDADVLAYGVGFYLGDEVRAGLDSDGLGVNYDQVVQGFADGLMKHGAAIDPDRLDDVLEAVHREMQERQVARLMESDPAFRKLAEENAERSAAFIEANAQREGVRELFEGVQYEVLEEGDGAQPGPESTAVVTFEASTITGGVFRAGNAQEAPLSEIRPTPARVLQQMKVGDVWRVVISPEAGFGLAGDPPDVGPNEVVIIEVELLEVR